MSAATPDILDEELESFTGLDALDIGGLELGRFSVHEDGARFDFFLSRQQRGGRLDRHLSGVRGAERLYVLLSGAVDRPRQALPHFDRWSWSDSFPGHVLCVGDPTLHVHENLRLGWYLGTNEIDWTRSLALVVSAIARQLGVAAAEITFYGSSGGGFAAIMLATRVDGSGAIAINPQTNVLRYHPRAVKAMLIRCFPGTDADSVPAEIVEDRLSIISGCKGSPETRVLIAQNRGDKFHLKKHFTPFCDELGIPLDGGADPAGIRASYLFDAPGGHGGEPRGMLPELIVAYEKLG